MASIDLNSDLGENVPGRVVSDDAAMLEIVTSANVSCGFHAGSPEGIALGDQIMAYALANAGRFGLQDVIWRGTYYTPAGPQASGYGHFDHVHLTVTRR